MVFCKPCYNYPASFVNYLLPMSYFYRRKNFHAINQLAIILPSTFLALYELSIFFIKLNYNPRAEWPIYFLVTKLSIASLDPNYTKPDHLCIIRVGPYYARNGCLKFLSKSNLLFSFLDKLETCVCERVKVVQVMGIHTRKHRDQIDLDANLSPRTSLTSYHI